MTARLIAGIIGLFYLAAGIWAYVDPAGFASSVATFPPFNRHLLHDSGSFSTGLGLVLIFSASMSESVRPALIAVLGASLLHLSAHIEDIGLGGHPSTDIPILSVICVVLVAGAVLSFRPSSRAALEANR